MCTVTFIPTKNGVLLTSNRDERIDRKPAEPPAIHYGNNILIYPKDAKAGGTWIALKNGRDAAVLLNGGFENHQIRQSYRRSRGMVLIEIVEATNPVNCFDSMSLEDIEPFTLVLFTTDKLMLCTWDGNRKHLHKLDATRPHIWASVTLYCREAQQIRAQRLEWWLRKGDITSKSILNFHLDPDIRFNASQSFHPDSAKMATVSVTSIDFSSKEPLVYYHDLLTKNSFVTLSVSSNDS